MKKLKKINILLTIFMIMGLFSNYEIINVDASTKLSLSELKAKFPAGKYWNHNGANNPDGYTSNPCTHHGNCDYYGNCACNSYSNSIQCMGYAFKLGFDAFGTNPRNWSTTTSLSNLKAGDVIRYKSDRHSIFVTSVNGDTVTYSDCNSDNHCKIRWDQTISKSTISASLTRVYVAPDKLNTDDGPSIDDLSGPVNLGDSFSAKIRSLHSDKILTYADSNVALDSVKGENMLSRQIFNFRRNSDNSYYICSSVDNSCLSVSNGTDSNGINICMNTKGSLASQKWFIYKQDDGMYTFRPANSSSRVLDVDGGIFDEGRNIQLYSYNGMGGQKFDLQYTDEIVNLGDDVKSMILNYEHWKPIMVQDNNNVVLGSETRDNMNRIVWHMYRDENYGYYTIYSYFNGNVLEVENSGTSDGTNIQVNNLTGDYNQKWYVFKRNDGSMYLRPASVAKVLDLDNGNSEEGTNIQLWTRNDSDAQIYSFWRLNESEHKIVYEISSDKTTINQNEKTNIDISNALYAINYEFHIIDPNGKETIVDNKCNHSYQFTGTQLGTYTIFAKVKSPVSTCTGSKTERCIKITVNSNVERIILNKSSLNLEKGKSVTLTYSFIPTTAIDKNLTWTTSNSKVATVENGVVKAVGVGTATITVKTSNGKTATCQVIVKSPITDVALDTTSQTINKGSNFTLKATINPSDTTDSKTLTWTTSNNKVATVENGVVKAVGVGTATIIVGTSNGKAATCQVTVKSPITDVALDTTSKTINKGSSFTLKATINPSDTTDSKTLTWTTSNSKVATVSNGVVKAIGAGAATITVKTSNGKTATCQVTVKEGGSISTQDITTKKNQTISIPVYIQNNPGIIGLKMEMKYDSSKLQLLGVEDHKLLSVPVMSEDLKSNPYILSWGDGLLDKNNTSTGKLVTVKFKVLDVSTCNTTVTFKPTEAYGTDLEKNISFLETKSTVKINNRLVGDVNGDGEVKLNDALLLRRYIANNSIKIVKENADVNCDGEIKLNDALLLRRYIAGWKVELK